ncbi:XTP/dITP diphosphatase [Sporosarcina gallistercoris]|uniref:dITP/XTP pyrophosphatase n=1 Tax=Sporosarcina gallistercoris TaxID=2762245 RepID=A0ABR8PIM9_9BACL|nr:XTP/dITP diphosphatase [Sporosarcina gallistercoris]MBD7908016.1 XTP/dITP diphosphatase [Sporosarcina gallistercoris]
MKQILVATNNKGKVRDFEELFKPHGIEVISLKDLVEPIEVEETGTTFEENAILKAEETAKILGKWVISDDSGLEIDALNGEPGVYSARYAGEPKDDEANIDKALHGLKDVPEGSRDARFRCVLAIAGPGIETKTFSGSCDGSILLERHGENGFGYDPIFYVPSEGKSMAELTPAEKAAISHRGVAMRKFEKELPNLIGEAGMNA